MSDIVKRLRAVATDFVTQALLEEAAAEIERLETDHVIRGVATFQVYEEDQAEIERLKLELRHRVHDEEDIKVQNTEIERLQTGWELATKAVDENQSLKAEIERLKCWEAEARACQRLLFEKDAEIGRMQAALGAIVRFCDDPDGSEKSESLAIGLARLLPAARRALEQK